VSSFAIHLAHEPGSSQTPVTVHRDRRDSQHFGRFFDAKAAEVAQFDDTTLAWIESVQGIERIAIAATAKK
jgi:hypothetical protein